MESILDEADRKGFRRFINGLIWTTIRESWIANPGMEIPGYTQQKILSLQRDTAKFLPALPEAKQRVLTQLIQPTPGKPFPDWLIAKAKNMRSPIDYGKLVSSDESRFSSLRPRDLAQVAASYRKRIPEPVTRIIDVTAHIGVDTLFFAYLYQTATVDAVEINPDTWLLLANNILKINEIIGPDHATVNIWLQDGVDYLQHTASFGEKASVVYFDPPWGGTDYKTKARIELTLGDKPIGIAVGYTLKYIATTVIVKAPNNMDFNEFELDILKFLPEANFVIASDPIMSEKSAVSYYLHYVQLGTRKPFPYWHNVMKPATEMFAALKSANLEGTPADGYKSVLKRRYPEDYMNADGISNHFTETERMKCSFGGKASPETIWRTRYNQVVRSSLAFGDMPEGIALREALYSMSKECNIFNPAFGLFVLRALSKELGKPGSELRIMDPSSGWGDRCIAACAIGASVYHGYDPNRNLQPGYEKLIQTLAPTSEYRIQPIPFETAEVNPGYYDIVLTSPPFFDLERYTGDGDAIAKKYPEYEAWKDSFYRPYIANAWKAIAPGGFLGLYVNNIYNAKLANDAQSIVMEFDGAPIYVDIYGFRQTVTDNGKISGKIRPLYVWRKQE